VRLYTDEDSTLEDAVEKHTGGDWPAISALVPGRTQKQCWNKWYYALVSKSLHNHTEKERGTINEG
jgi:hypothetical protein